MATLPHGDSSFIAKFYLTAFGARQSVLHPAPSSPLRACARLVRVFSPLPGRDRVFYIPTRHSKPSTRAPYTPTTV
jgi:hypothetical protein